VNNAGYGNVAPIEDTSIEELRHAARPHRRVHRNEQDAAYKTAERKFKRDK